MENFDFIDRKLINIDLALGFLSDENRLTRQQLIIQTQTAFAQAVMQLDPSVPELYFKVRRPYEETLRVLGVKDVDAYLPSIQEVGKMQAKAAQPPSPENQQMQSKAELNKASTQEKMANAALLVKKAEDIDMDNYFESVAAKRGKLSAVEID
jgi:hypothetical protein